MLKRKFNEIDNLNIQIKDISDLIKISQTNNSKYNLNLKLLEKILPDLQQLNEMIGMKKIKNTLFLQIIYYLQDLHKRDTDCYLHSCIYGSCGSGKTSLGYIVGNIYSKLGILSREVVKIAYRDDFVSKYSGQTAEKTKKLLES